MDEFETPIRTRNRNDLLQYQIAQGMLPLAPDLRAVRAEVEEVDVRDAASFGGEVEEFLHPVRRELALEEIQGALARFDQADAEGIVVEFGLALALGRDAQGPLDAALDADRAHRHGRR